MIALRSFPVTKLVGARCFPTRAEHSRTLSLPERIFRLHRIIVNPSSEIEEVRNAKRRLLAILAKPEKLPTMTTPSIEFSFPGVVKGKTPTTTAGISPACELCGSANRLRSHNDVLFSKGREQARVRAAAPIISQFAHARRSFQPANNGTNRWQIQNEGSVSPAKHAYGTN